MNDDSDEDDRCNCIDCVTAQPNLSFRIKEVKRESNENQPESLGLRKEFYVTNKAGDEALPDKTSSESPLLTSAAVASTLKEASSKQRSVFIPETIECVKIAPEIQYEEEKVEFKCTKCIEKMDSIDILNQGTFKVTCTDGCKLILHRNCFEKTLGSGKKKELKSCICPTNNCSGSVVIEHRVPGKDSDFALWLRCDVRESDKPRKEEKGKDAKKKEKDKHKKADRREEEESRKVGIEDNFPSTQSNALSNTGVEPSISLAVNIKKEEECKKNFVRPLPADLEAHPIERKEDALMSKYAVKETNTKENKKKNKKEVRQVILPGLTVKGQRGKKEDDDQWDINGATPSIENEDEINGNGRVDNNMRYDESPYGFMMPEEMHNEVPFRERDWIGGGLRGGPAPNNEMNNFHSPFHHPLPVGQGGIFRPTHMNESSPDNSSSQPLDDNNGRTWLSGLTESPAMDDPPLIEDPFDYPTLERESVRKRKDLINFFETHAPILEENAALFDSPQIDLDQLMCMLENFIEFQFLGNEEEKQDLLYTLKNSIFGGDVENDIFPFLMDLHCFKFGYVDGRLVVSVKTEGRNRREREDEERRRKEEEVMMKREKEEIDRRKEEKKKEEVRRAVLELEERQRRLDEERRMDIERREEEERKARDRRRKEEEERRQIEMEERRMDEIKIREEIEEANRRELKKRLESEDRRRREMEAEDRKRVEYEYDEKVMLENQKKKIEEKRIKEEEERQKRIKEMMDEEEERRKTEEMNSKKGKEKKTKERELERKTREAINTLRNENQSKNCSSDSSPERKPPIKCHPSILRPLHSSAFSSSAPPFVPRSTKPELNPNAPAFFPIRPSEEVPTVFDEKGAPVHSKWMMENEEILEEKEKKIDELSRRIAKLEDTNKRMEECNRMREIDMSRMEEGRAIEDKKNNEKIRRLENEVGEKNKEILWKDQTISEMSMESSKKLEERRQMENNFRSERETMKLEVRDANTAVIRERREKEIVVDMKEREDEEKRRNKLERKTDCAMESIISCTQIINSLASDPQAQVMTSIFIDLREKWIEHHSMLNTSLNTLNVGVGIDWDMVFSLEIPSMPRETDELVKECYAWHYQTIHNLSYRLAFYVKKCLLDHHRDYEDALIIGIIQKWMRTHKDLSKIEAKVPQVANMVAIAYEGRPIVAPKYVYVRAPIVTPSPPVPTLHTDRTMSTWRKDSSSNKNEPKGWKKASEKKRDVELDGHECSICLEDTAGGDISYCEQVSCNEPYHNDCLDIYWSRGFRNCPRCRIPMPPRDAYPALG